MRVIVQIFSFKDSINIELKYTQKLFLMYTHILLLYIYVLFVLRIEFN